MPNNGFVTELKGKNLILKNKESFYIMPKFSFLLLI